MEASIRSQLGASQLLQFERETTVEPHARLLEVVIAGIELQQKDPGYRVRSVLDNPDNFVIRYFVGKADAVIRCSDDVRELGRLRALVDTWALCRVMERVERKDKIVLREVLRAMRSIRDACLIDKYAWTLITGPWERTLELLPNSVSASQPGSQLAFAFNAAVAAVLHLLAFVFQYLIGCVDRGGSKTFSSGAFDFRATFVSLVLFQGSYVWIKFRAAAPPYCRKRKAPAPDTTTDVQLADACDRTGIYEKVYKDKSTGTIKYFKYEPRLTPPKEKVDGGPNILTKRLPLGEYHTRVEAMFVLQIARYYYGDDKDEGCLMLHDGPYKFSIPPLSEQERGLAGEQKRKWVTRTAKQVGKQRYADLQREKGKLQSAIAVEAGFHAGHGNGAGSNGPCSSALPLTCSPPAMLTTTADEPAIVFRASSSLSLPLPPFAAGTVGDGDDFPGVVANFDNMINDPHYAIGLPNDPAQSSILDSYCTIFKEVPEVPEVPISLGAVTRITEPEAERELSPVPDAVGAQNIDGRGSSVFLQQSDPVLQQVGTCEKKLPEDTARQNADLNHRLTVSQRQNSELQKEKELWRLELQKEKELWQLKLQKEKELWQLEEERLRTENESLKCRLREVAKISSCDLV